MRFALATLCLLLFTCGSALYSGVPSGPRTIELVKRSPGDTMSSLRRNTLQSATPLVFETIPDWSFGPHALKKPTLADLEPDLTGYLVNDSLEIVDFLQKRLIENSEGSNFLSNKLRTPLEVTMAIISLESSSPLNLRHG